MVIISTSAVEVSIQAVSPLSSLASSARAVPVLPRTAAQARTMGPMPLLNQRAPLITSITNSS